MAQTKKGKALERLRKALDEMPELKQFRLDSPSFKKWRRDTEVAITNTFDSESSHINDFQKEILSYVNDASDAEVRESVKAILESMVDEINKYWGDESEASRSSDSHRDGQINTKEVFIVHGRNKGAREKVARFLERLELKPVVLHEQPNEGRTIIEKFEDFAHVGFAVVLLTPDDIGRLQDDAGDFRPRARQNVIFEFGYFIGKLGRERVCALVKGNVERPSDYDGVVYVPLDDLGGWEMKLVRELTSVGYKIDLNRLVT